MIYIWREVKFGNKMAARWVPNIEEFVEFFNAGGNIVDVEDDRVDFFCRRIEDYEQTSCVVAARSVEAVPNQPLLHNNISWLLNISANVRARLQDCAFEHENRELKALGEIYQAPSQTIS